MGLRQVAGLTTAMALLRAELEVPACDLQWASFDKSPCQAAPCPRVDALHRRAGHPHLHSTFFLRHAQVIHEADALIVFDLHPHGCLGLIRLRRKARIQGHGADAPRLCHSPHTFHLNPPSIFLTYVIYCQYSEFADICQHKMRAQGCVGGLRQTDSRIVGQADGQFDSRTFRAKKSSAGLFHHRSDEFS